MKPRLSVTEAGSSSIIPNERLLTAGYIVIPIMGDFPLFYAQAKHVSFKFLGRRALFAN
jgi:hypothetical protein